MVVEENLEVTIYRINPSLLLDSSVIWRTCKQCHECRVQAFYFVLFIFAEWGFVGWVMERERMQYRVTISHFNLHGSAGSCLSGWTEFSSSGEVSKAINAFEGRSACSSEQHKSTRENNSGRDDEITSMRNGFREIMPKQ